MQKPLSPLQAPALSSARHGTTSSTTRRGALLSLSALALALGGCGGSGGSAPQPGERAAITLLVYIIGSDLESDYDAASGNIEEMQSVTPNARVNVVLSTGGADKDGWRTVQRKRINGAQIELLADLGPVNMGRQETLQDFITWGMQSYPAERTLLVLWNHGGGPTSASARTSCSTKPAAPCHWAAFAPPSPQRPKPPGASWTWSASTPA